MSIQYIGLISAYLISICLWFNIAKYTKMFLWASPINYKPTKPSLEFGLSILTVVVILIIGQLYLRDWLIPNTNKNVFVDAFNQIIIFSPIIALLIIRNDPIESLWLRKDHILQRVLVGFILALIALFITWIIYNSTRPFVELIGHTFNIKNTSHLTQIFLEDITIALVLVRLSTWIGKYKAILIVSILFAASHIPSMIVNGVTFNEMGSLILDSIIGVIVLIALSKSQDIWWFIPLHFVMDMTQYFTYT